MRAVAQTRPSRGNGRLRRGRPYRYRVVRPGRGYAPCRRIRGIPHKGGSGRPSAWAGGAACLVSVLWRMCRVPVRPRRCGGPSAARAAARGAPGPPAAPSARRMCGLIPCPVQNPENRAKPDRIGGRPAWRGCIRRIQIWFGSVPGAVSGRPNLSIEDVPTLFLVCSVPWNAPGCSSRNLGVSAPALNPCGAASDLGSVMGLSPLLHMALQSPAPHAGSPSASPEPGGIIP